MLISVTRLRLRSLRYLPSFFLAAQRSSRQAERAKGNRGVGRLRDANWAFWTRTAWEDEAALRAFMAAEPHRSAMRKLADWCDEAAVVHWSQDDASLPDWHDAHRRLLAEGRRLRVRRPSAAHETLTIPAPQA